MGHRDGCVVLKITSDLSKSTAKNGTSTVGRVLFLFSTEVFIEIGRIMEYVEVVFPKMAVELISFCKKII